MRIQKNKNSGMIKFLESVVEKIAEKKKSEKKDPEWQKIEPAKHLDNKNVVGSRNADRKILSSGEGAISDMGGPKRHMRSESTNSIWDSEVLERLAQTISLKEKTVQEKTQTLRTRNHMEEGRLDEMVDSLKQTDQRKASSVSHIGDFAGDNYKPPQRNISIFDTEEFARIPKKTVGEKISENAQKPKEKDESWKQNNGTMRTSRVMDKFLDSLIES